MNERTVVELLHHLVSLLSLLLVFKEDTHTRNHFILLERVDVESPTLHLKGLNDIDINESLPMRNIPLRDFKLVVPDIIYKRHGRQERSCAKK